MSAPLAFAVSDLALRRPRFGGAVLCLRAAPFLQSSMAKWVFWRGMLRLALVTKTCINMTLDTAAQFEIPSGICIVLQFVR